MVHALTLAIAQDLAWRLAASRNTAIVLVRAGSSYGVVPASAFDGDASAILCAYDPLVS